jgi:hypothetical protein
MFGAACFSARFLDVRFAGGRALGVLALRGERDLRAMILPPRPGSSMPWPARKSHAGDDFRLAAGLRRTSGN